MRVLVGLLAALPLRLGYLLAGLMAFLLHRIFRYRRATVAENLRHAFPDKSEAERAAIAASFYRHLCNLAIEIIHSPKMSQDAFSRRVQFSNMELLEQATGGYEKQAIVLLIHQGNWEWMLHAAMAAMPVSVDPVYKPLHSAFWDRYMLAARSRFGASPMTIQNVGREVIRGRKRKRLIVMLADQAGPRERGYWRSFLNRPASFYRGADKLAQALDLPLLFARCERTGTGHYRVSFHELSLPPHPQDGDELLNRYVDSAERMIALQPETYLWSNRRWKKAPPEDFLRRQEDS